MLTDKMSQNGKYKMGSYISLYTIIYILQKIGFHGTYSSS